MAHYQLQFEDDQRRFHKVDLAPHVTFEEAHELALAFIGKLDGGNACPHVARIMTPEEELNFQEELYK